MYISLLEAQTPLCSISQLVYPSTNTHCFNKLKIDFLLRLILESSPNPSFDSIQEKKLKFQIICPTKRKLLFLSHFQILYNWLAFDRKTEEIYFLYTIMLKFQYLNYFFIELYLEKFLQVNVEMLGISSLSYICITCIWTMFLL